VKHYKWSKDSSPWWKDKSGHKIKTLRSDSGGEHVSNEFVALCDQEGMVCDMVMVHPTHPNC
jgi:hypothetical protein